MFVFLFHSASGASASANRLHPCPTKKLSGAGLGSQACGCSESQGTDSVALYGWRRGNVVFVAQTLCEGCKGKAAPIARAFALLLDANAKLKG